VERQKWQLSSLVLTIAFASKTVCGTRIREPSFSGPSGFGATLMVKELRTTAKSHGVSLLVMMFGRRGLFAIMPTSFDDKAINYFMSLASDDRGARKNERS
jgi:hypothetical protein